MAPNEIRIKPPADLEKSVMEPLMEEGIFPTKYKLMAFAAALGFYLKRKDALAKTGEGIRRDYFQRYQDDIGIDLFPIVETGELKMIEPERESERVTAFQEYAHAGLLELRRVCFSTENSNTLGALNAVLSLMDQVTEKDSDHLSVDDLF